MKRAVAIAWLSRSCVSVPLWLGDPYVLHVLIIDRHLHHRRDEPQPAARATPASSASATSPSSASAPMSAP